MCYEIMHSAHFLSIPRTQSLQVALDTHDVRRKHLGSIIELYSRHDRTPVPLTFGAEFILLKVIM